MSGTTDQLNEVPFTTIPTNHETYYFAFFFRFDRKDGVDIWPVNCPDAECFDKAAEFTGNGIRWTVNFGERGMGNQAHHFSVLVSNPTYHVNPQLEVWDSYYQNYNGYSPNNSIQLEYEKWHSIVFKFKWALDNAGELALWVDGTQVMQYSNVKTTLPPGDLYPLLLHGTYAQPAYDIPAHYRKYDAFIYTDNWQDIVDGGYLRDPEIPPDTTPPACPTGLSVN